VFLAFLNYLPLENGDDVLSGNVSNQSKNHATRRECLNYAVAVASSMPENSRVELVLYIITDYVKLPRMD